MRKKGFTLIELLVVIAIIGILAVAFLPNILGAPSKARDTVRISDLKRIQESLIAQNLNDGGWPNSGCTTNANGSGQPITVSPYYSNQGNGGYKFFKGDVPVDPLWTDGLNAGPNSNYFRIGKPGGGSISCNAGYVILKEPDTNYSAAVYARVENIENATGYCENYYVNPVAQNALATQPTGGNAAYNTYLCRAVFIP